MTSNTFPDTDSLSDPNSSDYKVPFVTDANGKASSVGMSDAHPPSLETNVQGVGCPVCGLANRPGVLVCERCGRVLVVTPPPTSETKLLQETDRLTPKEKYQTGEVIVAEQKPLTLEIGDATVTIPINETITLGRTSDNPADVRPDLDLNPYGAGEMGVSRLHLTIKRKNILMYATDLGSTNGTSLNGRRLLAHAERLLRNGDEITLGRLKLIVRF